MPFELYCIISHMSMHNITKEVVFINSQVLHRFEAAEHAI